MKYAVEHERTYVEDSDNGSRLHWFASRGGSARFVSTARELARNSLYDCLKLLRLLLSGWLGKGLA